MYQRSAKWFRWGQARLGTQVQPGRSSVIRAVPQRAKSHTEKSLAPTRGLRTHRRVRSDRLGTGTDGHALHQGDGPLGPDWASSGDPSSGLCRPSRRHLGTSLACSSAPNRVFRCRHRPETAGSGTWARFVRQGLAELDISPRHAKVEAFGVAVVLAQQSHPPFGLRIGLAASRIPERPAKM